MRKARGAAREELIRGEIRARLDKVGGYDYGYDLVSYTDSVAGRREFDELIIPTNVKHTIPNCDKPRQRTAYLEREFHSNTQHMHVVQLSSSQ